MNLHAHQTFLERISKNAPHAGALKSVINRAFEIGYRLEGEREKAAKDPRLTEVGRREKVAEIARAEVRALLDAAWPQQSGMAQVRGQRGEMRPKPLDRADAVGELRRQEIRSLIRKTPQGQRYKMVDELALDTDALEAVMDAPAALSGLPADQYGQLRAVYMKKHFGEQTARLDALEEDLVAAGGAIEMCMTALKQASGMHDGDFRKLVAETQADLDGK